LADEAEGLVPAVIGSDEVWISFDQLNQLVAKGGKAEEPIVFANPANGVAVGALAID